MSYPDIEEAWNVPLRKSENVELAAHNVDHPHHQEWLDELGHIVDIGVVISSKEPSQLTSILHYYDGVHWTKRTKNSQTNV